MRRGYPRPQLRDDEMGGWRGQAAGPKPLGRTGKAGLIQVEGDPGHTHHHV